MLESGRRKFMLYLRNIKLLAVRMAVDGKYKFLTIIVLQSIRAILRAPQHHHIFPLRIAEPRH